MKRIDFTDSDVENEQLNSLSYEEKNKLLYERQKKLLDEFLEHGAISKAQHDKSLHDLTEKMAGLTTVPGTSGWFE